MNTFPPPTPAPLLPPVPPAAAYHDMVPTPAPKKSHWKRNVAVGLGALVVVAGIASMPSADAETSTGASKAAAPAATVAPETIPPSTEPGDNPEVLAYVDEIQPLLQRSIDVFNDVSGITTVVADNPQSWIDGDYISETIAIRDESESIYDAWLDIDVPAGFDDVDDATGAVFSKALEATEAFADSAAAGDVDVALTYLTTARAAMDEVPGLTRTATAELGSLT